MKRKETERTNEHLKLQQTERTARSWLSAIYPLSMNSYRWETFPLLCIPSLQSTLGPCSLTTLLSQASYALFRPTFKFSLTLLPASSYCSISILHCQTPWRMFQCHLYSFLARLGTSKLTCPEMNPSNPPSMQPLTYLHECHKHVPVSQTESSGHLPTPVEVTSLMNQPLFCLLHLCHSLGSHCASLTPIIVAF